MFLSKKTKPESLTFIKKIISNYNINYRSNHNNDRISMV